MSSEKIDMHIGQVSTKQGWTAPLIVTLHSSETEGKQSYNSTENPSTPIGPS